MHYTYILVRECLLIDMCMCHVLANIITVVANECTVVAVKVYV
jgi:hypothetical protein